jgi:hypothetical protein
MGLGSKLMKAWHEVDSFARSVKDNDIYDYTKTLLGSGANVATLGGYRALTGEGSSKRYLADVANVGTGGIAIPLHNAAILEPRRKAEREVEQEQARAEADAAYAQTLIPQAADLGEIRRQRLRRLALSRSSSGAPGVLGAPTGAKTALGL